MNLLYMRNLRGAQYTLLKSPTQGCLLCLPTHFWLIYLPTENMSHYHDKYKLRPAGVAFRLSHAINM